MGHYPSVTSCKQDLDQDTRYGKVSRSWEFSYKIFTEIHGQKWPKGSLYEWYWR